MIGWLYPRTVRAKLTLSNVLILALALIVLAVVLRSVVVRNLLVSVDRDLRARSVRHTDWWTNVPWASHDLPNAMRNNTGAGATVPAKQSPGMPAEPDVLKSKWKPPIAERVFNLAGMQSYPRHGGEPPWDRSGYDRALRGYAGYSILRENGVPLRIYTVPLRRQSGKIAGVVQLASSLEGFYQALDNLDRALLALLPLGLLAAWGAGMLLTGRMLRPLREITRTAATIGAHDLSRRLDVTGNDEFSELETTFNGVLARLEASFEKQTRFTADASHELRTPLTVIKSVSSRLLARSDMPGEYRRGLERLDRASNVMEGIVGNLLLLARSDAGQLEFDLRPTQMTEVLGMAIECVQGHESVELINELGGSSLAVLGERSYLTRLFVNLLDNAVRHTPAGGSVTISGCHRADHVLITIADTGIGIPPEHLQHVAERFYRVDDARSRAQGGTGLGLAICKSIVETHGGSLLIESTEGQGTKVTVVLTAAREVKFDGDAAAD